VLVVQVAVHFLARVDRAVISHRMGEYDARGRQGERQQRRDQQPKSSSQNSYLLVFTLHKGTISI